MYFAINNACDTAHNGLFFSVVTVFMVAMRFTGTMVTPRYSTERPNSKIALIYGERS